MEVNEDAGTTNYKENRERKKTFVSIPTTIFREMGFNDLLMMQSNQMYTHKSCTIESLNTQRRTRHI